MSYNKFEWEDDDFDDDFDDEDYDYDDEDNFPWDTNNPEDENLEAV
jgi:hypothetical protein